MIVSNVFTIETRLNQKDNSEIIECVKEYSVLYGKMIRFTWHRIKDGGQFPMKESEFNTLLQKTFGVNRRVASSVIYEVIGIYKALYQLKWNEFFQLKTKISKKYKKYEKFQQRVYVLKEKAKSNSLSSSQLSYYRKLKADLFYVKQKLNRMNRSLKSILVMLNSRKLEICFGSKKLFLATIPLNRKSYDKP